MAAKNWIRISASPQLVTGTAVATNTIDLSAYVDPLHSLAFRIQTVSMTLMENDVPYGICNQSVADSDIPFALQMATGAQTVILRPSDGKVIYHNFGKTVNDADAQHSMQNIVWEVTDIWPNGYIAVIDTLTVSAQAETSLGANFRYTWTLSGYQEKVTSNQLASLLVAQTA